MPLVSLETPELFQCLLGMVRPVARRLGREPAEAISTVWEVLKKRFPSGVISGANPDGYLAITVQNEAKKFYRKESLSSAGLPTSWKRQPLVDQYDRDIAMIDQHHDLTDGNDKLSRLSIELRKLTEPDREFINICYGIGQAGSTSRADLAHRQGVSRQAVDKRRRRIIKGLRASLSLHSTL